MESHEAVDKISADIKRRAGPVYILFFTPRDADRRSVLV